MEENTEKKRGFAALDPEVVKEISRKGGKAAHARGTAHKWSREEAKEAGRKGGLATREIKAKKNNSESAT